MSTKQFTVRIESQGGAKVKTDLAGIGEAGKAAHEKISQGARESSQSTEQMTQEQARAIRSFQQLKASIDPAYAAQLKYDKAVQQVQRATVLGIASKEEEKRVLAQLQAQHDQTIAAMQKGVVQTTAIGKASGASASQVANLGAQFNDIGVMLAAGQSPLQLAVQQGSQINQVFAQMGGGTAALRGVAAGFASMINPMSLATIGIIAGGAALVQWAQSAIAARNDTVDMEKAVDNLLATVSEVSSYNEAARQSLAELRKEFGDNAAAVRDNAQALGELAAIKAVEALKETLNGLSGSASEAILEFERLDSMIGSFNGQNDWLLQRLMADLTEEVGFTVEEALRLRDAFSDLSAANGLEGARDAAQALYSEMIAVFGSAQDIPPELQEAARQALQAANAGYDIEAALTNAAGAASDAEVSASGLAAQLSGATAQARALIANLGMVPAAMAGLANDVVTQVESMRVANAALTDQLQNGTDARIASLRAERNAILNKMEVEGADMVAQADRIATMDAEIATLEGLVGENVALTTAISEAAKASTAAARAKGGSARASRAEADAVKTAVEQLQQQIEADRELIGLSDDLVSELEARRRVEDALARDKVDWNEAAIQGLTDQIILNQRLREEAEQTSGVLRTVFDGLARGDIRSIGSGLLDMAQGSFSDLLQTSFAKGGKGLGGVWDSITSGFTNLSDNFSKNGFGGAVAGLLPALGAVSSVVGVVQSFIGTTTKLTNALEGTLGLEGLLRGTEYDIKQRDNIFGSKTEKNAEEIFGSWAGLIAQDLDQEFRDMVANTREGIRALGLDVDEAFTYDFDVKFDESLPHEQLMERLRQELNAANDALLRSSLAAAGLARDGESGAQTLQALNASLTTANASLRLLDQTLFDISAIGAGAARDLVEVAGGLDAFSAKTTFVFDNFLTETERTDRALQIAAENMAAFEAQAGITLPETHAEFMALLDAQDLNTAAGRNLYAALLDVADEFVTVNGAALDAAVDLGEVGDVLEDVADTSRALADIERERQGLVQELYTLVGAENALRGLQRAAIDDSNLALFDHIQALKDQADAARDTIAANNALLATLRSQESELLNLISAAESALGLSNRTPLDDLADAQRAYEEALSALASGIERERGLIETEIDGLTSALSGAADALGVAFDNAPDLTLAQQIEQATSDYEGALSALASGIERERGQIEAQIDGLTSALSGAADALGVAFEGAADVTLAQQIGIGTQAYNDALIALQAGIDRERSAIEGRISSIEAERDALENALAGVAEKMRGAARDIFGANAEFVEIGRRQAFEQLRRIAAGADVDPDTIDRTLNAASNFNAVNFRSREDLLFEQKATANLMDEIAERDLSVQDQQLQALDRQIALTRNELRALDDLEREFGLIVPDLNTSELAQNLRDAKSQLESLFADGSSELSALNNQLTVLGNLERDFGLVATELTTGELADDVTAAKAALEGLFADGSAEIISLNGQLTALEAMEADLLDIKEELTIGDLAANFGAAKTALELANTNAATYHGELIAALGGLRTEIGNIQNANEILDGIANPRGDGGSDLTAFEQGMIQILENITGAGDAAALGASAFSQFNASGSNAIISESAQALLTGFAADIAAAYDAELGRNVDVRGLRSYTAAMLGGQTIDDIISYLRADGDQFEYAASGGSTNSGGGTPTGGDSSGDGSGSEIVDGQNPDRPRDFIGDLIGNNGIRWDEGRYAYWTALRNGVEADLSNAEFADLFESVMRPKFDAVPSYAVGTNYHPGGPAITHENEWINLPRGTGVSTATEVRQTAIERRRTNELLEEVAGRLDLIQREQRRKGNDAQKYYSDSLKALSSQEASA